MIPNLFFDLSSPESTPGVFSVAAGVSSTATGVFSAATGVSSAATGVSSTATGVSSAATNSSGSSFSDVINGIHNKPQATEINNKNESGYEAQTGRDGHFPGSAGSEAFGETTARMVNAAVRQSTEFEGDRALLPGPADPEFSLRNPSGPTGSPVLPTGKQLLPTGKQLLPTGSHLLPTGSHLLPTGNHLLPTGNRLPPTGQSLPAAEWLNNQFGSDAVSVAHARQSDRQALTAAPAAGPSIVGGADVAGTTGQSPQPPAGETQINEMQAPKLIRTRVAVADRSGQPVPALSVPVASPEGLNGYAGRDQATAARYDISAVAVAARVRGDGSTTAELTASSAAARVSEDQVRDGQLPRDALSRELRNVHIEAERSWRNATQIPGEIPRESLLRSASPSALASAIATMNMDPSAEMGAGAPALNAPGLHLKSGDPAARRLQQSAGAVSNPMAMTLDTLDAQRVDVAVPRPELQMALADRPPAAPGGWQPPATAAENRTSSSRANRSLAAAAAISGAEQPIAENSNASSLLGTDATRAENPWLRAELNGQSQQLGQQVARQILFAHNQNLSQMRMQLNPEELGQLDLRLRIEGDRVHVAIVAQHNGAREILEAQLPQLRSLLEEGGFELGDVDVRHQGGDGASDRGAHSALTSHKQGVREAEGASVADSAAPPPKLGIIDAFA